MELTRVTELRSADGHLVPAYLVTPASGARGGAAIAHGYGGCKEQMLGLAVHLVEAGIAALALDLRGHGEHPAPLDANLLADLEAGIAFMRRFGRVAAIGHSLGGRLALLSSADLLVGSSPAIASRTSVEGRQMLVHFGSTAVRAAAPAEILDIFRAMPDPPAGPQPKLLMHAAGDIPTLIEGIRAAAARLPHAEVLEVTERQHAQADLSPGVLAYLPHWFNHLDLKFNPQASQAAAEWITAKLTG
jgi:dienelactone hydrolase